MRCHRCGVAIVMHVVGEEYCVLCRRDIRVREEQDARRAELKGRFRVHKDLTPAPYGGAAA